MACVHAWRYNLTRVRRSTWIALLATAGCTRAACARPGRPGAGPPIAERTAASRAAPSAVDAGARAIGESVDAADGREGVVDAGAETKRDSASAHSFPCSPTAAPRADWRGLAARGRLSGLAVDVDALVRPSVGVPEVVALLGPVATCTSQGNGFADLELAPRLANVRAATVETHDGDLIGVVVEYEAPVSVDLTTLSARYGRPSAGPSAPDSFRPGDERFVWSTPTFDAYMLLSHDGWSDPPRRLAVTRLIVRRTPRGEGAP